MSRPLEIFKSAIDANTAVYTLQYQALAEFMLAASMKPEQPVTFIPPGSYAPMREPMSFGELTRLAPAALASLAHQAAINAGIALDAYLYHVGRRAYESRIGKDLTRMDDTWYRPDMIEVVTGVDPKSCVCWPQILRLQDVMAGSRNPSAPVEQLNQSDLFALLKDVKVFATDFEASLKATNPKLKLP